jgi:hypothetical protein
LRTTNAGRTIRPQRSPDAQGNTETYGPHEMGLRCVEYAGRIVLRGPSGPKALVAMTELITVWPIATVLYASYHANGTREMT